MFPNNSPEGELIHVGTMLNNNGEGSVRSKLKVITAENLNFFSNHGG